MGEGICAVFSSGTQKFSVPISLFSSQLAAEGRPSQFPPNNLNSPPLCSQRCRELIMHRAADCCFVDLFGYVLFSVLFWLCDFYFSDIFFWTLLWSDVFRALPSYVTFIRKMFWGLFGWPPSQMVHRLPFYLFTMEYLILSWVWSPWNLSYFADDGHLMFIDCFTLPIFG